MSRYPVLLAVIVILSALPMLARAQDDSPIPIAEIPFEKIGSHLFIQLQVNDEEEPCNFIFDTGAAITAFDKKYAEELNLKPDYETTAMGAAGAEVYQVCENQQLRFDQMKINSVTAILSDFSSMSNSMSRKISGVVGSDFIRRYLVELNYTEQKIRLIERESKVMISRNSKRSNLTV